MQFSHLCFEFGDFAFEAQDLFRIIGLIGGAGQQLSEFLHPRLRGFELLFLFFVEGHLIFP
jgi:hypothetical protein